MRGRLRASTLYISWPWYFTRLASKQNKTESEPLIHKSRLFVALFQLFLRHWSSESFFLASILIEMNFLLLSYPIDRSATHRNFTFFWFILLGLLFGDFVGRCGSVCVSTALTADNKNSNNAGDNNKFVALFTFTPFTWLALPIRSSHGAGGTLYRVTFWIRTLLLGNAIFKKFRFHI